MIEQGFVEFPDAILTAISPEGASDYLVPSRLHPAILRAAAGAAAIQQIADGSPGCEIAIFHPDRPCFRAEVRPRRSALRAEFLPARFGDVVVDSGGRFR